MVGVLPSPAAKASLEVDKVIVSAMGNARDGINVLWIDVAVACGARSAGTVSEIALALKPHRKVNLLNPDSETNAFFQSFGREQTIIVHNPAEALAVIKQPTFVRSREGLKG